MGDDQIRVGSSGWWHRGPRGSQGSPGIHMTGLPNKGRAGRWGTWFGEAQGTVNKSICWKRVLFNNFTELFLTYKIVYTSGILDVLECASIMRRSLQSN